MQARKDTDRFHVSLQAHEFGRVPEALGIIRTGQAAHAAFCEKVRAQRKADVGPEIAIAVAQQRDQVVTLGAQARILIVEEGDLAGPIDHEIATVPVEMDQNAWRGEVDFAQAIEGLCQHRRRGRQIEQPRKEPSPKMAFSRASDRRRRREPVGVSSAAACRSMSTSTARV